MPFNPDFEKRVNEDMREGDAGPAPRSPSRTRTSAYTDTDIKKRPQSVKGSVYEEDIDFSAKKDRTLPPRFSTLFGTAPPPSPRVVECCHREEKKKSGVYLSTPVFVLLVIVLLFESTLLFAYTVIGLYQNLPSGLLAVAGMPAPVDGRRCEDPRQAAINFAPNFVFGGAKDGEMGPLSILESIVTSPQAETATTTATSSLSSTTTSTTRNPTSAAAAASQLLGLLGDQLDPSSSTTVAIVTETPGFVQSTIVVTSSAGSESTEETARPTVTSVQIVDGPAVTVGAR